MLCYIFPVFESQKYTVLWFYTLYTVVPIAFWYPGILGARHLVPRYLGTQAKSYTTQKIRILLCRKRWKNVTKVVWLYRARVYTLEGPKKYPIYT